MTCLEQAASKAEFACQFPRMEFPRTSALNASSFRRKRCPRDSVKVPEAELLAF
jgi:hypothetical protein